MNTEESQAVTFTVYYHNPFDLCGVLVSPWLAFASGVEYRRVSYLLKEYPRAVAVSRKGLVLFGKQASQN